MQDLHAAGNVIQWQWDSEAFAVHVCHQYKHLGTWIQTKHRHSREISLRASVAKQQFPDGTTVLHQEICLAAHKNQKNQQSGCLEDDV